MNRKLTIVALMIAVLPALVFAGDGQASKFKQLVDEAKQNIKEIDVARMKEIQSSHPHVLIVDVREKEEWDEGHLKGARHISRGILEWQVEKKVADSDRHIVLYCGGGNRSALSAESLQKMGYLNVYSLVGGYSAILEAGLDVEK